MLERERSPYLILRQDARDLLNRVGIRSNPGFTDRDIVDAVREFGGLLPSDPWDEWSDQSFKLYRDNLVSALQEAGVELKEPVTETAHIIEGLRILLAK